MPQMGHVGILVPDYVEFPRFCASYEPIERGFTIPEIPLGVDTILCSNPNNPTGTVHDLSRLLRQTNAQGQCLVVDEAYAEFDREAHSLASAVPHNEGLVVIRTFSKFYGMPGVAYALGHPRLLERIRVSRPSEDSLYDAACVFAHPESGRVLHDVDMRRNLLSRMLAGYLHCHVVPSRTHFVMARNGNLYSTMRQLNVCVVNLNENPGIQGMGYCRVAVPSYTDLDDLHQRVVAWTSFKDH